MVIVHAERTVYKSLQRGYKAVLVSIALKSDYINGFRRKTRLVDHKACVGRFVLNISVVFQNAFGHFDVGRNLLADEFIDNADSVL